MDLQNLKVKTRDGRGKGHSRRTRRAGDVPATLYGGEGGSISLTINARTFDHLVHGASGEHAIVQLDVEDDSKLSGPAMLKQVQHHPVRGNIIHADLMRIDLTQEIRVSVAVRIEGRAPGLLEGGVIDHQMREIEVECLALNVPEFILVDVSELNIGDSVHVRELEAIADVTIISNLDRAIVAVQAPRVQVLDEEVVEGEGEEGIEGVEGDEAASTEEGSEEGEKKESDS